MVLQFFPFNFFVGMWVCMCVSVLTCILRHTNWYTHTCTHTHTGYLCCTDVCAHAYIQGIYAVQYMCTHIYRVSMLYSVCAHTHIYRVSMLHIVCTHTYTGYLCCTGCVYTYTEYLCCIVCVYTYTEYLCCTDVHTHIYRISMLHRCMCTGWCFTYKWTQS